MDKKVFKTLEFDKVLKTLAGFTDNEEVRERILSLAPCESFSEAKKMLSDTTEAVGVILRRGNPQNLKIKNVSASARRAQMGGVMTLKEIIAVRDLALVSAGIKAYIKDDKALEEGTILHFLCVLQVYLMLKRE